MQRPTKWQITHDDGADGCMPTGWYAIGLGANGFMIDRETRHEYGPFASAAAARRHARRVDREYQ